MRVWSIHPKYLDTKRLTAVWRETLLAKAVLEGKTKGYKNHPQLIRFKQQKHPLKFINSYLKNIYNESVKRGYNFDITKIGNEIINNKIPVTDKQLMYEINHLKSKLKNKLKNSNHLKSINSTILPEPNPIFKIIKGNIESWEKVK